jgi:hypothetical protein
MSDKAVLVVLLYMAFSFGFGVFVGKAIKWGRGEDHERPR